VILSNERQGRNTAVARVGKSFPYRQPARAASSRSTRFKTLPGAL
jgi:hypothetical protein